MRTGQHKLLTGGVTALWFKSQAGMADDDIFIRDICCNCNITTTNIAYITQHHSYQTPFKLQYLLHLKVCTQQKSLQMTVTKVHHTALANISIILF